jgi:hypothetical protein
VKQRHTLGFVSDELRHEFAAGLHFDPEAVASLDVSSSSSKIYEPSLQSEEALCPKAAGLAVNPQ